MEMPHLHALPKLGVMQRPLSLTLTFFVLLLVASWLYPSFSGVATFNSAASRATGAPSLLLPSVEATETTFHTTSGRVVNGLKETAGTPNARPFTARDRQRDNLVRKDTTNSRSSAGGGAARATVRYWTRPNTFWTPPDLSAFPSSGIIPHKWRPRYNPKQYHLNSLMVVQFEWDRMGERWGYAPLGPWCGLCQTLKKGCRAECQQLCGEHCEGLGTQRFTDEIGCLFCGKDDGYGCRKYTECRDNCTECTDYKPFVNQTTTKFAWGPLKRDIFGTESTTFPDKEANEPWTPWENPITYDRTPVEVEL